MNVSKRLPIHLFLLIATSVALGSPRSSAATPDKKAVSMNQVYQGAYQSLSNGCKKDASHGESLSNALEQIQKSNNKSNACDPNPNHIFDTIPDDFVALEGLRRLKLLKEAQTIESYFTYEILYGGLDLQQTDSAQKLVDRVCSGADTPGSFSSIAIKEAKKQRIASDPDMTDEQMKMISVPKNLCGSTNPQSQDFKNLVERLAAASIRKFKNQETFANQKKGATPAALKNLTPFLIRMKEACGEQGTAPPAAPPKKPDPYAFDPNAELKKNNQKFATADRTADQANLPARKQKADYVRSEFDAIKVSQVIAEMAMTPFGRLLVTKSFRDKIGIPKLALGPLEIKQTCTNLKTKFKDLSANSTVFTQDDVKRALSEIRREIPKSLGDTLPYRFPQDLKPNLRELDKKLANELEIQPDAEAAMKLVSTPPRLLSRFCSAISVTEKDRKATARAQQALSYVSTGLMIAGAAISFTGLGAPLGIALMGASASLSIVQHSVQKSQIRDDFFRDQARGNDQFYAKSDGSIDTNAADQRADRTKTFNQSAATLAKAKTENNQDLGISLVTTATGFGATKLLSATKFQKLGMLTYDVTEAGAISAVTSGGDTANFATGFAANFASSQIGEISKIRQRIAPSPGLGFNSKPKTKTIFDPFENRTANLKGNLFVSQSRKVGDGGTLVTNQKGEIYVGRDGKTQEVFDPTPSKKTANRTTAAAAATTTVAPSSGATNNIISESRKVADGGTLVTDQNGKTYVASTNGTRATDFNERIGSLSPGTTLRFSDGSQFQLQKKLGEEASTAIYETGPNTALRINKREYNGTAKHDGDWTVDSYIKGYEQLKDSGIPLVPITKKPDGTIREWVEVEKYRERYTFDKAYKIATGQISSTPETVKQAQADLQQFEKFVKTTKNFAELEDFHPGQVIYDERRGWILGDYGAGNVRIGPSSRDAKTVFDGQDWQRLLGTENWNITRKMVIDARK